VFDVKTCKGTNALLVLVENGSWQLELKNRKGPASQDSALEFIIVKFRPSLGRETQHHRTHKDRSSLTTSSNASLHRVASSLAGRGSGLRQYPP